MRTFLLLAVALPAMASVPTRPMTVEDARSLYAEQLRDREAALPGEVEKLEAELRVHAFEADAVRARCGEMRTEYISIYLEVELARRELIFEPEREVNLMYRADLQWIVTYGEARMQSIEAHAEELRHMAPADVAFTDAMHARQELIEVRGELARHPAPVASQVSTQSEGPSTRAISNLGDRRPIVDLPEALLRCDAETDS